jgi:hypothetical protein
MSQAAADLQAEFGSANVADWRREVADEDVRHTAAGVTAVPAIHWINRPTFQQVVQLPGTDHFKCYRAKSGSGAFARRTVTLADVFGSGSATVIRPETWCNPADEDGEGVGDSTGHLECFKLSQPGTPARTVNAANQFGVQSLSLTKVRSLCLPSGADGVPVAGDLDHYKCYKAGRGTPRFVRRTVSLADRFETKSTLVLKPDSVCVAVDKNGEGVHDPTAALTCYRIKDTAGQPRFSSHVVQSTNQFGTDLVASFKTRTLCVPSSLQ